MKYLKNFSLSIAVLFAACFPASAQGTFDEFNAVRTILVTPIFKQAGNVGWSNNPIDLRSCIGIGKIDISVLTNGVAGATTIHIYTSADQTNWTTLANCAIATNSINSITTNNYYGTGTPLTTNQIMLAGTITLPSAYTAGFATPYILPNPFTATGVIAANQGGHYTVGFNIEDASRYLSVEYDAAATSTNIYHAVFTGHLAR